MKFIHSKQLLSAYYVPVIVLGIRITTVNKTNIVPTLKEIICWERHNHKKLHDYDWNKYYKGSI